MIFLKTKLKKSNVKCHNTFLPPRQFLSHSFAFDHISRRTDCRPWVLDLDWVNVRANWRYAAPIQLCPFHFAPSSLNTSFSSCSCSIFLQRLCTFDLNLHKMTHADWIGSMPLQFNWMKNIQNEQWLNAVKDICALNTGYKMFHLYWVSRDWLIHLTRSPNDRCLCCNQATTFQFIANLLCVCASGWNLCSPRKEYKQCHKSYHEFLKSILNHSRLIYLILF